MTERDPSLLDLDECRIDLARGLVHRADGSRSQLGSRELDLLRYLAAHPSQLVARERLMTEVWGAADRVLSRACDHAVHRLRTKIEGDPAAPVHLITVFGEGYRFELGAPAEPVPSTPEPTRARIALGDRQLDLGRHRVHGPDGEVALTANEVAILERLVRADGAIVDRARLQREIWGRAAGRALDNAVFRLRQKLEPEPDAPVFLHTARGGGYRLEVARAPAVAEPSSSLLGRDAAAARIAAALLSARWVVVVGPGGMGKTRIARRVAAARAGPVWWIDLAAAQTREEAATAVVAGLGLVGPGDPVERAADALAARGAGLLVLDNLEQLAEEVSPLVRRWLEAATAVRILGTSRIRLGLDGEVAIELDPLLPEDAERLFIERARAAAPGFSPVGLDREAVRDLVARLDGMPLAIELAAARVPVLAPAELLARIGRRLDLLSRPRAAVERHRSLRAVLAGSWELLAEAESDALCTLALFGAGFGIDDAEELLGAAGVDLVQALRDHSLVHARADGPPFGVYAAIRDGAAERRAARSDGGRAVELAWAGWLARLGDDEHLARLFHAGEEARTARHRALADDLERAIEVALAWAEPEPAARLALAAAAVRRRNGPFGPLLARLRRVIAAGAPQEARLLALEAELLVELDQPAEALAPADRAIAAAEPGPVRGEAHAIRARALFDLGRLADSAQEGDRAAEHLERWRPERAAWHRARAEVHRGQAGLEVRGERALALYEAAFAGAQRRGDLLLAGSALVQLARFDHANARPRLALERYREALRHLAEVGAPTSELSACLQLQVLLMCVGDLERHDEVTARATALVARTGSRVEEAVLWSNVATVRILVGDHPAARAAIDRCRAAMSRTRPLPRTLGYLELREAEMLSAEGDQRSARALAEAARERLLALGDAHNVTRADVVLGLVSALDGALAEGTARVEAAVGVLERTDPTGYDLPVALAVRGRTRALAGDRAGAEADLARAEELAGRAGLAAPRSECGRAIGRLRDQLARA